MKITDLILTFILLCISSVHAQDKRSGVFVGVDASYESMSVKTPTAKENFGSGSSLILHAGYELPFNDKFAVLLGGIYDIDYELQGGPGSNGTIFTKGTEKLKQKNKWGIYAAPGIYLADNRFVYAKLSYVVMKTDPEGVRSSEPNFTSVGYGIGYRYTFMKDNLISLEWASLPTNKTSFPSFKSGAEIAPNLSMLTVGWAKKFE